MRKTYLRSLWLIVFSFVAIASSAQDYATRTVNGAEYYVYYVEPGNTLFAISKIFSVSVEALVDANEGADKGLDIGREILVPIQSINKKEAKKKEVKVEGDQLLHTVQKKETLFSISKVYGVSVNDLTELNPHASEKLATGVILRVPAVKSSTVKEIYLEPARNDSFVVHQVQVGETLFSLSKQYGLTQDSLVAVNPSLELGAKNGQYIVIPAYTTEFVEQKVVQERERLRSDMNIPSGKSEKYKIALMLPFELEANDSIENALMRGENLFILTEIALEYYRGTILALDSLQKLGSNIDLHVYEIGDDIVATGETLKLPEIKEMDMIIGPMHKASLALVSDMAIREQIYLVSPNSFANEVFEDNPYLLRASTSRETMLRYLANFVAINHTGDNVLMLNSEFPKEWPMRREFVKNYNLAASTFSNAYSDSLRSITKELFDSENEKGRIYEFLRKDTTNIIIVPSNDLAFVSEMMTKIAIIDDEYPIQVYGLDKWINYENIEVDYKNKLNLRIVVPSYVDYEEKNTIEFLKEYREYYGMEPSSFGYGFKAYDLMLFFGKALLAEGLAFPLEFSTLKLDGTAGSYRFGKSTTGKEFENKQSYILEYKDFEIRKIN
ncbi:MAG: LysM peptidoglycan-binding domain-containing protein [Flavobacteriales bacterium]|nr:LysM peptidoglycan-binding domain-containing protein [Flavobacteriales bacterium]